MLKLEDINVSELKIEMKDLDPNDTNLTPEKDYDIVQLKYDGWWSTVHIENGIAHVITSGGEIRDSFEINSPDCVVMGEWIYGTNWAQSSPNFNNFILYDIVSDYIYDVKNMIYAERFDVLLKRHDVMFCNRIKTITQFDANLWREVWKKYVEGKNYEGLVFKSSKSKLGDRFARMKRVFSLNYVVMDFKEGTKRLEGTLGAIEAGLFIDGKLVRICSVGGGFTDGERNEIWKHKNQYRGKVIEVTGKALFSSGALRHPNFKKFRPDVEAKECILPIM